MDWKQFDIKQDISCPICQKSKIRVAYHQHSPDVKGYPSIQTKVSEKQGVRSFHTKNFK